VQPTGYTTVLKLLQIMTEKGLVQRDESQQSHVYRASQSEARTQKQLVGDLLERADGGSAPSLRDQGRLEVACVLAVPPGEERWKLLERSFLHAWPIDSEDG
jgi:hypothetical protein